MSDLDELLSLIEDAAAKCHEASHKARELNKSDIEQETAQAADTLEQLYREVEE